MYSEPTLCTKKLIQQCKIRIFIWDWYNCIICGINTIKSNLPWDTNLWLVQKEATCSLYFTLTTQGK